MSEKDPELPHVAIDALDQFAGRVLVVKAHIQVKAVAVQFDAQCVVGDPGQVLADIRRADGDHLLQQGDADKGKGSVKQILATVAKVARRRGLLLVLNAPPKPDSRASTANLLRQISGRAVLYADRRVHLCGEVLKELNETYRKKKPKKPK